MMVALLGDFRDGVLEDPLRTLILNGSARNVPTRTWRAAPWLLTALSQASTWVNLRAEAQRLFARTVEAYGEPDYLRRDASELFPPVYAPAAVPNHGTTA